MCKDMWLPKEVKKTKSLDWGTSKEKNARKNYVWKNKSSFINFI